MGRKHSISGISSKTYNRFKHIRKSKKLISNEQTLKLLLDYEKLDDDLARRDEILLRW